jgi:HAD superfamily hydrolase (TIGR01549 family)
LTITLLLDLDDTLLTNDIERFLPAYLQALSKELVQYTEPDRLIANLMAATAEMVRNQRPDRTLQQVFDAAFYPALNSEKKEVSGDIERFYEQVFPGLARLTGSRPEAIQMVDQAMARGYRIAVATNPLFPRTAILQRLAWAELPIDRYPFELVTSYEDMHFAKPNPAYFAEILAYLGWPEGSVVMVGDDLERDIVGARRLGLPAFLVSSKNPRNSAGSLQPTASGGLKDLLPWLERQEEADLLPDYNSPAAMMAILRSTPAALDNLCNSLTPESWVQRPRPKEWCPTEILCHLRDVDVEVNLPRLEKVLQEDNPFIPGKDTDPWAEERDYIHQDGPQALIDFTRTRIQILNLLEGLQPQDWQRTARHAIFGTTHLSELVQIIAGHDRLHIRQLHQDLDAIASA